MTRDELVEQNHGEPLMFLDGPEFDIAIVGRVERFGQPAIVCYDYLKVLDVLTGGSMSREDAEEYFEFNILGAWLGDTTPCFLHLDLR